MISEHVSTLCKRNPLEYDCFIVESTIFFVQIRYISYLFLSRIPSAHERISSSVVPLLNVFIVWNVLLFCIILILLF